MPSIVTRPVITSMAPAIRLNWRTVVAVTWGWRQWKSVTISTIGEFRCGLRVVVLHNATLHDNGPPHLIFGEGIDLITVLYRRGRGWRRRGDHSCISQRQRNRLRSRYGSRV